MLQPMRVPYVLGLDIGVQSVGWALAQLDEEGNPCGILRLGVRSFESSSGSEQEIEKGTDEPASRQRREKRLMRRQLFRRQQRLRRTARVLQQAGLLPQFSLEPASRDAAITQLDAQLRSQFIGSGNHVDAQLLPYRIRAAALDRPLPVYALGRAFYHLAQRRGFLSNKKASAKKDDEDKGKVKAGIAELTRQIEAADARTLGEFFARLDPHQQRIRSRWTSRKMYQQEFDAIWEAQAPHHPQTLTAELKARLYRAIFFQRPLKSQKGLIGRCSLEKGRRRAPLACLEAQRLRYWQKLNDLRLKDARRILNAIPEAERLIDWLPQEGQGRLTLYAKQLLAQEFETNEELTFNRIRQILGLKKKKDSDLDFTFNLEEGDEKKLPGNRTAAKLLKALGQRWQDMPEDQRQRLVDEILSFEKEEPLARRLEKAWGFSPSEAANVAAIDFEQGYHSFSRQAIRKILPHLQQGQALATIIKQLYKDTQPQATVWDRLPPLRDVFPQVNNPVVRRALTEVRKVVNAILRVYGKPQRVHIELARDLKKSRHERQQLSKGMRQQQKQREDARNWLQHEMGISNPTAHDILKYRLWIECEKLCPYTGKPISKEALFGSEPQFDVEHIIPYSRCLDNSFANKTLCEVAENRAAKKNRTPYEAYGNAPQRWHEILQRVSRFRGDAAKAKLRRFQLTEIPADFANRHLNDTRYSSRLASEYLSLLYGGRSDAQGNLRVQASTGAVTSLLRDQWGLNAILAELGRQLGVSGLDDDVEKARFDHRHHAVDALVIALTTPGMVKRFSDESQRARQYGRQFRCFFDPPWGTRAQFVADVRDAVLAINVSRRVDRRLKGPLHEETIYGKPKQCVDEKGKTIQVAHVRKPLESLSPNNVDHIVDPVIRELVKKKLQELGTTDPKKAFQAKDNHPYMKARDGRIIPIHKVRIRVPTETLMAIGHGPTLRHVKPGVNHHMEIVATLDAAGNEIRWEGITVSLFEALQRLRNKQPVVQRDHGPGKRFKFSLSGGEYLEFVENGRNKLVRVSVISGDDVEFRLHNDARPNTMLRGVKGARAGLVRSADALRKLKARKVLVDPLGNILPAND